jgi:hypothetical protein
MMAKTHFYTDERTFWHCTGVQSLFMPIGGWVEPPAGVYGADTPASKRRLLNLVRASGLIEEMAVSSAAPAPREAMLAVHTPDYIETFRQVSDAGGGQVGSNAPFSVGAFEIAALSAGLALAAVAAVMDGQAPNAYALCRPAGHHCLPDQAMGFCLLANIPIAIEAMKVRHPHARVAVVDWDVHHGNGTQTIYYDRADVLTISLHQENCFPRLQRGGRSRRGRRGGVQSQYPASRGQRPRGLSSCHRQSGRPRHHRFCPRPDHRGQRFRCQRGRSSGAHAAAFGDISGDDRADEGTGRKPVRRASRGGARRGLCRSLCAVLRPCPAGRTGRGEKRRGRSFLPMLEMQQPGPATRAFQLAAIDELARALAGARATADLRNGG